MLKLTQQEFTGLPQHLQLELLIGTALCLIGKQPPCKQHNLLPCHVPRTSYILLLLLHITAAACKSGRSARCCVQYRRCSYHQWCHTFVRMPACIWCRWIYHLWQCEAYRHQQGRTVSGVAAPTHIAPYLLVKSLHVKQQHFRREAGKQRHPTPYVLTPKFRKAFDRRT
jgi:hypothetical protein